MSRNQLLLPSSNFWKAMKIYSRNLLNLPKLVLSSRCKY
jgi:hypothetical protein